jgi:hypothetical protein
LFWIFFFFASGSSQLDVEWSFVDKVREKGVHQKRNIFDGDREVFEFVRQDFEDAVVMPSYRNIDQVQLMTSGAYSCSMVKGMELMDISQGCVPCGFKTSV